MEIQFGSSFMGDNLCYFHLNIKKGHKHIMNNEWKYAEVLDPLVESCLNRFFKGSFLVTSNIAVNFFIGLKSTFPVLLYLIIQIKSLCIIFSFFLFVFVIYNYIF